MDRASLSHRGSILFVLNWLLFSVLQMVHQKMGRMFARIPKKTPET